jgi:UDP-hydrolysing UDP-N-acetyl-D-glucosamine 2-epimerase
VDDALRHAITKLSHIHFAATKQSVTRLRKMGEDRWRIVRSGSPGIDGIREDAASFFDIHHEFGVHRKRFALLALHPTSSDDPLEQKRARRILLSILNSGVQRIVVVYPNTDPGSEGIRRCWECFASHLQLDVRKHIPRGQFLGLLRDCAFLIGNSSGGIIEAASFGTPVIDIGPRQQGRECGRNVAHVEDRGSGIRQAIARIWRQGSPLRFPKRNIYGSGTAKVIAQRLASIQLDERLKRKLIAY